MTQARVPRSGGSQAEAWTGSTSIAWSLLGVYLSGVRLQNPELGVGPSKLCFRKPPKALFPPPPLYGIYWRDTG